MGSVTYAVIMVLCFAVLTQCATANPARLARVEQHSKTMYAKFDKDNSGFVELAEVGDADKDGKLSPDEFEGMFQHMISELTSRKKELGKKKKARVVKLSKTMYAKFDKDASGFLELGEVGDADNDGKLSKDEFAGMFEHMISELTTRRKGRKGKGGKGRKGKGGKGKQTRRQQEDEEEEEQRREEMMERRGGKGGKGGEDEEMMERRGGRGGEDEEEEENEEL